MAQINVKLDSQVLDAFRRVANTQRTPMSWIIRDYVEYLIAGGTPVSVPYDDSEITTEELMLFAEQGGSLDWLKDEPDLYTMDDGEPI